MGKVIAEQSVSLDGFSAGPNIGAENPMGDGGEQLHEWMFPVGGATGRDGQVRDAMFGTSGAVVMGRRMFELGLEPWGDEPPFHMPVYVVTHRARDSLAKRGGTTYHFVIGGIENVLAAARSAAADKDIAIVGGANTIQQFIRTGLVDELRVHLVPVLLGDGTRLFDRIGPEHVELENASVIDSPGVTHLTFRFVK
jgi:dihydrofolate reductase